MPNMFNQLQGPRFADAYEEGIKLGDLQRRAALEQQQVANDEAIRASFKNNMVAGPDGTPTLNNKGVMSDMMRIDPIKGLSYKKQLIEQDQAELAARQKKRSDEMDLVSRVIGSVKDQASYDQARGILHQNGVDTSFMPKPYDEKAVAPYRLLAMSYKEQKDQQFKEQDAARKDRELNLKGTELNLKRQDLLEKRAQASGTTVGQKKVDSEFAKDYNDWTSAGRNTVDKNLDRLRAAKQALQQDPSLTGSLRGLAPDFVRNTTNEKAIVTRDDVRAAAQGALRATLGPQFTEREGNQIMDRAYNERLSPEANIAKIDAAIKELERNKENNDRKAAYFQQRGTLTGFELPQNTQATVRMRDPKGNIREVPASQAEAARRAGGQPL